MRGLEMVEYSQETMHASIWSHSGSCCMRTASREPSMWLVRANFLKVSSKNVRHCRKLASSMSRVTGTWPWMLRTAMVAAEGGAPGEGKANGLECTEELEEWESAMAIRREMQQKGRIK